MQGEEFDWVTRSMSAFAEGLRLLLIRDIRGPGKATTICGAHAATQLGHWDPNEFIRTQTAAARLLDASVAAIALNLHSTSARPALIGTCPGSCGKAIREAVVPTTSRLSSSVNAYTMFEVRLRTLVPE